MSWQKGPLPQGTYNWGAVVTKECGDQGGFFFADFLGDRVKTYPENVVIQAEDILWYTNCIEPAPTAKIKDQKWKEDK